MNFWIIKHKHAQPPKDISSDIINKALERYHISAQEKVREILCHDCLDRRCLSGSKCKAFLTFTDSVAWDMSAGNADMN